jgi:hypothetical protein
VAPDPGRGAGRAAARVAAWLREHTEGLGRLMTLEGGKPLLEPVFDEFVDRLVSATKELRLGDPLDPRAWSRSGRPSTSTWTPEPSASRGGIPTVNRDSLRDRIKQTACPADGGGMFTLRSPEVGC